MPDHKFFLTSYWSKMLIGDSAYFAYRTNAAVRYDVVAHRWSINVTCNIKDSGEIQGFLSWLLPHVDAYEGAFLGYIRHEPEDLPQLIYMPSLDAEVSA